MVDFLKYRIKLQVSLKLYLYLKRFFIYFYGKLHYKSFLKLLFIHIHIYQTYEVYFSEFSITGNSLYQMPPKNMLSKHATFDIFR